MRPPLASQVELLQISKIDDVGQSFHAQLYVQLAFHPRALTVSSASLIADCVFLLLVRRCSSPSPTAPEIPI